MKHLIPTVSLLLLTACTSYKEDFDCEAVPGVGCKSIAEVDRMIDEGKLGDDDISSQEIQPQKAIKGEITQGEKKRGVHVWIASYSNDDGILHGSQSLFVPLIPNPERAD